MTRSKRVVVGDAEATQAPAPAYRAPWQHPGTRPSLTVDELSARSRAEKWAVTSETERAANEGISVLAASHLKRDPSPCLVR